MGLPWYLNPLWEWDLHDRLDVLEGSSSSSRADDQRQDKEIERLKTRVTELENQLLVLEKFWQTKVCYLQRRSLRRQRTPPSVHRTPLPSFPPGQKRSSPVPAAAAARRAIGMPATPVACCFDMKIPDVRRLLCLFLDFMHHSVRCAGKLQRIFRLGMHCSRRAGVFAGSARPVSATGPESGSSRPLPAGSGNRRPAPAGGRAGAGTAARKRAGAPCKDIRRPCRPIGRPRRLSRPDRGGRRLSPLRPPPEGQSGFLLRLWPAVSI